MWAGLVLGGLAVAPLLLLGFMTGEAYRMGNRRRSNALNPER